jgi:hypothetical protein
MNSTEIVMLTRRRAIRRLGAAAAGMAAIARAGTLLGQEALPELSEDNPRATALQYTSDATSPDMFIPVRREGAFCRNCRFFQGEPGQADGLAPCEIFPEFRVKAGGWCNSWAELPA